MKSKLLFCMGVVLAMTLQVQAVFIPDFLQKVTPGSPYNTQATDITVALGISPIQLGELLYLSNGGDNLFTTVIATTPPPPGEQTATLTYDGIPMTLILTYIVVKDYKAGWTLWDASDWNGVDAIQVDNRDLWNPKLNALSGISHIAIYGTSVPSVPDGGLSFVLLGLGMLSVTGLKRIASP